MIVSAPSLSLSTAHHHSTEPESTALPQSTDAFQFSWSGLSPTSSSSIALTASTPSCTTTVSYPTASTTSVSSSSPSLKKSDAGDIAGGAVAGFVAICSIALLYIILRHRARRPADPKLPRTGPSGEQDHMLDQSEKSTSVYAATLTPYTYAPSMTTYVESSTQHASSAVSSSGSHLRNIMTYAENPSTSNSKLLRNRPMSGAERPMTIYVRLSSLMEFY